MIANFVLLTESSYMVRNVCPGTETVYLCALEEEQLFVGAPFSVEYGEGILLDDTVGMCCWIMRIA